MTSPDTLPGLIAAEHAMDRHWREAHRAEAARHGGVAWSGLSAAPAPPRTDAQIRKAAEIRQGFQDAWRSSSQGAALAAVARIQAACAAAHAAAEHARAAAARGLPHNPAPCQAALQETRRHAADLLHGLRAARRALIRP
jgi:hypothetical protein